MKEKFHFQEKAFNVTIYLNMVEDADKLTSDENADHPEDIEVTDKGTPEEEVLDRENHEAASQSEEKGRDDSEIVDDQNLKSDQDLQDENASSESMADTDQQTTTQEVRESYYPRLELRMGPAEGLVIDLKDGEHIIGRSKKKCTLTLDDTSVSRVHARLEVKDGVVKFIDMGSRNGSYVNGRNLTENQDQTLEHLDQLKIGIYVFRVALKEVTKEDKVNESMSDLVTGEDIPVEPEIKELLTLQLQAEDDEDLSVAKLDDDVSIVSKGDAILKEESPINKRAAIIFVVFGLACVIAGAVALYVQQTQNVSPVKNEQKKLPVSKHEPVEDKKVEETTLKEDKKEPVTQKEDLVKEDKKKDEQTVIVKPTNEQTNVMKPDPIKVDHLESFNALLDITSQPSQARLYLDGEFIGVTPLKKPFELKDSKDYELKAEFDLKDVGDQYQDSITFKASAAKDLVSLVLSPKLGEVIVKRLPRDAEFYLEGYYDFDKKKENPVKVTKILYGKPIILPYGTYKVELKERVKVGDSETFVNEVKYQREFEISKDKASVTLDVDEKSLKFFPAEIDSIPSHAHIYLNDEEIGMTPFKGDLPIGRHELRITKDGFFESTVPLEMRTNTPYIKTIKLDTSKVGMLVNEAKEAMRQARHRHALDKLIKALKSDAKGAQKAQIHYMMGESFLMIQDVRKAGLYFKQAMQHKDYRLHGLYGLARVDDRSSNRNGSILKITEVLLNSPKGSALHKQAYAFFKTISPLKSVIYVTSQPEGSNVYLDDQFKGKTPLILSDLGLGHYRLKINKAGYQEVQIKQNLKLSEFIPIIVNLNRD